MDIVKAVAAKGGYTQKATKEVLGYLEEVVLEAVSNGEKVKVAGITVEVKDVPARRGMDISTGQMRDYPPTKAAKARVSKALKLAAKGE